VEEVWAMLLPSFKKICEKHPDIERANTHCHLGTLGTGNHFIEVCLDESQAVWVMLHSGSRGVGARIGATFIALAKKDMEAQLGHLPDKDLAYFTEGAEHFDDYAQAVQWAQYFASTNRAIILSAVMDAMRVTLGRDVESSRDAVSCHHNYVQIEQHFGEKVYVTRKGAVHAGKGVMGIIPGSMGARSYIVRGKGNADSFNSCSHGAGRVLSRTAAKKKFTLADHEAATAGVECRKDEGVLDETPGCYKDIDAVMAAQSDLVEVVHTLKQVLCVKG
jgi:tRNA-splicing ligase RtcB